MLNDFLYSLPATLGAAVIVTFTVAATLATLLAVHRFLPLGLRRSHNDIAGFLIAVVGVIYAVLLAFIAVAVWEDFNRADAIVQREASLAGDIYEDAVNMRGAAGEELRRLTREYLEAIIGEEWPALRRGASSDRADRTLDQLRAALFGYDLRGPLFSDLLGRVNSLNDERRDRLINASSGLQPVAWFVLLAGSALTILFACLFGSPDLRLHAVMAALLAASVAVVIFLIVSFDYPFRGAVSISPAPFEAVLAKVKQHQARLDPAPGP